MALIPDSISRYTANLLLPIYKYGAARWHEALNAAADLIDAAVKADRDRLDSIEGVVDGGASRVDADTIVLGAVAKTAWPTATPASGEVLLTGAIALRGLDGVTVTHSNGDLLYQVKTNPTGATAAQVGQISYVKSANTVVIYNTGKGSQYHQPLSADIEISAL